jgi:flagellar protein FliL
MAKTEQEPESATAGPKKGGKGKKLMIVGTATLTLLGAGVGAGVFASSAILGGKHTTREDPNRPKLVERSEEPAEPAGEEGKEAPAKIGTIYVKSDKVKVDPRKYEVTYYQVEQPFTANLADGSGFVQVGLSFATYFDGKVIANIRRQIVPIRSAVLMTLSEQDPAVVSTPFGKQQLQKQLTEAINRVLRQKEGFGGVENVYFTSLVIQ